MFSFLQKILAVLTPGIFLIMSASVFAEYDSKQKKEMNKESEELSLTNKNLTVDKGRSSKSDLPKSEDHSEKTIEEKRDINSEGPRADSDENTAAETTQPASGK